MSQSDKSGLRVSRFGKLCGLGNVLAQDEAIGETVIKSSMLQRCNRRATVGSVLRIREGNLLYRTVLENLHALVFNIQGGTSWNPEDQLAQRVFIKAGSIGVTLCNQLARVVYVRGEEEVERSPILDLLRERSGC